MRGATIASAALLLVLIAPGPALAQLRVPAGATETPPPPTDTPPVGGTGEARLSRDPTVDVIPQGVPAPCRSLATPVPRSPRRLWGTYAGGGCRPLLLLAPRVAWLDDDVPPTPERVCTELGRCSAVTRWSQAFLPECPTCEAGGLYLSALLELAEPLADVPPMQGSEERNAVERDPVLAAMHRVPPGDEDLARVAWGRRFAPDQEWSIEVAAELSTLAGGGIAAGASGRLGFRHFAPYSSESPIDGMGLEGILLVFATAGLVAVPSDVWLGNDSGLDVRAEVLVDASAGGAPTYAIGLAPSLRTTPGGIWRLPAVVGLLLPEVGVAFGPDRSVSPYASLVRAPFGVWLDRHVGFDLEPALRVGKPPWQQAEDDLDLAVSVRFALVAR